MITDLRDAIVREIKELMPDLKTCQAHPGKFDLAGLKKFGLHTPSVLVSCLGLSKPQAAGNGPQDREARFAIFILTTDKPKLPRDTAALNIVEALSVGLLGSNFGMDSVYPLLISDVGDAQNLYSSSLGNVENIALWALSWNQRIRIGDDLFDDSNGVLLKELYIDGDDHEQPVLSSK